MIATQIMTCMPFIVHESTFLTDAVELLINMHVSRLPVLDRNEKLIGVITIDHFLYRKELNLKIKHPYWKTNLLSRKKFVKNYKQRHAKYVGDIMNVNPLTVSPNQSLDEVVSLMKINKTRYALVVKKDKTLTGIITYTDIIRVIHHLMKEKGTRPTPLM